MTKAEAITKATGYGLAIYKGDTAKTIAARIAQHEAIEARNAAEAAEASSSFAATFRRYTGRRVAQVTAFRQMALAIPTRRDWSKVNAALATLAAEVERFGPVDFGWRGETAR